MLTPDYACKRHILGILHDSNANKASFTDQGIYDRYMTGIFMSYVGIILGRSTLAGPQGLPTTLCRITPAPLADLHRFSNGETCNLRLGPSKVPQPSVDLIYMAASARFKSLGRPVGTAELEIPTLSSSVLVWNGGGGVAIKEAWKERNPTKNVFNFANVESRYRGGLIKLSDSVRLHGASDAQEKVLKDAEKTR